MNNTNQIIIIGCSIPSLYVANKCLDKGYDVCIVETKKCVSSISHHSNLKIYNDKHRIYMNILKHYNIFGEPMIDIKYNNNFFDTFSQIINNTKHIPDSILMNNNIISLYNNNIIKIENINHNNCYDFLLNNISAYNCINMFKTDIVNKNISYYFLDNEKISLLFDKMLNKFKKKKGELLFNHNVKNVKYIDDHFEIICDNEIVLNCINIITTMSKDNLTKLQFWNNIQKKTLNSVFSIPYSKTKVIFYNIIRPNKEFNEYNLNFENKYLLDTMHIVFPSVLNKKEVIYLWKNKINNIIVREKIKSLFHRNFLICSESYSKNNMFVNYSFEFIDSSLSSLR